jgi:hypothetical protein
MAENTPFEPDTGNAGVGSGDHKKPVQAISFSGEGGMAFFVSET